MRKIERPVGIKRLNLIPILDAIFIFIFFLLMSTEFVHLVKLTINKDTIASHGLEGSRKDKFSLSLLLNKNSILVKAMIEGKEKVELIKNKEEGANLDLLYKKLLFFKKKFPSKREIVIRSKKDIKYEQIIKVIETVRTFKKEDHKDKKNYLYDQISFSGR
jgi:biopolymer transport protein ExbD